MDIWVFAALAGAGCLANVLKNVSRDKDNSSEYSSVDSNFPNPESPRCPLRRLARKKKQGKNVYMEGGEVSDGRFINISPLDHASTADIVSGEEPQILATNVDCNVLSVSSLPLTFSTSENGTDNHDGNRMSDDTCDIFPYPLLDSFRGEMSTYNFTKTRSSLRCKHVSDHFGKHPNSIESCLIAQLYGEHTKMEEYVLSSHSLPSIPLKPLLVTNGGQVISRANDNCFSTWVNSGRQLLEGVYSESSKTVFGVPLLPDIRSLKLPKDLKHKTRMEPSRKLNNSSEVENGQLFQILDGAADAMLPLCLGIYIGIMSSVVTNRKEVDKMKELLRQTENLVQDLREELEMKDLLTVKELATENFVSEDKCDCPLDGSMKDGHKNEECLDSMSRIEAELETELERLGLHIDTDTSSVQRRLSDHVEIDTDFIADFAEGELRADMVSRQAVDESDLDRDASSTGTVRSATYAVCPRELSLRLYEVIEARLEARVEGLETALQNSERKMELLESKHNISCRDLTHRKQRESNTRVQVEVEPLVLNVSGEALDAYQEAYEELMRMSQSEEDYSPSGVYYNHPANESMRQGGGVDGLIVEEGAISEYDGGLSGSDYDDESERLLIQQIVEKTKKGSPVVLNAQMLLFSLDQNVNS